VFLALLALAFATLLYQVLRMTLGTEQERGMTVGAQCHAFTRVAVGINVSLLGIIGLQIPAGLGTLLASIMKIFVVEMKAP
jgi:hypothetical protein